MRIMTVLLATEGLLRVSDPLEALRLTSFAFQKYPSSLAAWTILILVSSATPGLPDKACDTAYLDTPT